MCREIPDGGPLTAQGRRDLARMLTASAWHRNAFCLVAVSDGALVGFVNGRIDAGDGLLPGLAGEIESLWVVPEARAGEVGRQLARAAVRWLRDRDVWTIRSLVCADNAAAGRFWKALGFTPDMTCYSLYAE